MSFLDSLENNLKALESREEAADGNRAERARRQTEKAQALAAAPFAERLRTGRFTQDLLLHATQIGFRQRTKVNITWIGATLRLDAREKRLELRPTPEGVLAVLTAPDTPERTQLLDLDSPAETLAQTWLG
ncbi:MAG: hypothetical protein FJW40_19545 [Acidobacteria bacterium]|nr:hypothetical protein [Acidobacteriota bacterium]